MVAVAKMAWLLYQRRRRRGIKRRIGSERQRRGIKAA